MIAGSLGRPAGSDAAVLLSVVAAFCALVSLTAIAVLLLRPSAGLETRVWVRAMDNAVRGLGSPEAIFTIVILAAVWLFHRDRPYEVFAIAYSWTTIIALKPVEALMSFYDWWGQQPQALSADRV